MLDDHAKVVAKRNACLSHNAFIKYLRWAGYMPDEIGEMWKYAQRGNTGKDADKEE